MTCGGRHGGGWVEVNSMNSRRDVDAGGKRVTLRAYWQACDEGSGWAWHVELRAGARTGRVVLAGNCYDDSDAMLPDAGVAMDAADRWLRGFVVALSGGFKVTAVELPPEGELVLAWYRERPALLSHKAGAWWLDGRHVEVARVPPLWRALVRPGLDDWRAADTQVGA